MNLHILELLPTEQREINHESCNEIEDFLYQLNISFATEMNNEGKTICIRVYSLHLDQLVKVEFYINDTYPNLDCRRQAMDHNDWSSGWQETNANTWQSRKFEVLVEKSAKPTTNLIPIFLLDQPDIFGDGRHITTRLILDAIEEVCINHNPKSFLDFGAGNGILAIAAAKIGIDKVHGCEIDPKALETAKANIELNQVEDISLSLEPPPDKFDLVVCNIQPPLLLELANEVVDKLKPGGNLLLSGFTQLDEDLVSRDLRGRGLKLVKSYKSTCWRCLSWK